MRRAVVGSEGARDGGAAAASAAAAAPRLPDRATLAALIQRIPCDHYTLMLRRPAPGGVGARWQRALIADVTGHEVLATIDAGGAWLWLQDIDGLAPALTGPPALDLRHGLIIAAPAVRVTLPAARGSGSIRVLAGLLTSAAGAACAGETIAWGRDAAVAVDSGPQTAIALTIETPPAPSGAGLLPRLAATWRRLIRRLARSVGIAEARAAGEPPVEIRLVRPRSTRSRT